jgi:hypothetical protein
MLFHDMHRRAAMNIHVNQGAAVREACEAFLSEHGRMPERDEVVGDFVAKGANRESVRSEVSRWRSAKRQAAGAEDAETGIDGGSADYVPLSIAADGRLFIPTKMREAMMLDGDGRITAYLVDGELRMISPRAALRNIQRTAEKYKKPGQSVVDEFLAERRAMWGEE